MKELLFVLCLGLTLTVCAQENDVTDFANEEFYNRETERVEDYRDPLVPVELNAEDLNSYDSDTGGLVAPQDYVAGEDEIEESY